VYAPVLLIDHDPRKTFHGLNVHVLVKRDPRKLGPEGDIEPEGRIESPGGRLMGHDPHGGSRQITGKWQSFLHALHVIAARITGIVERCIPAGSQALPATNLLLTLRILCVPDHYFDSIQEEW
jgi:hypothetical protein